MTDAPRPPGEALSRVQATLRELWDTSGQGEDGKVRICTVNLVVLAASEADVPAWVDAVDEVTRAIPARALVVAADAAAPEGIRSDATAVCSLEGNREVCSERIVLVAGGAARRGLASAVGVLLEPELPTVVVAGGSPDALGETLEQLAANAQRLVVDGATWGFDAVDRGAQLVERAAAGTTVADLGWTRLAPWQELVARFFDAPGLVAEAGRVREVVVETSSRAEGGDGRDAMVRLFVGWLAARLGWALADPHAQAGGLTLVRPDGGAVEVRVHDADPHGPHRILGVRCVTEGGVDGRVALGDDPGDGGTEVLTWSLALPSGERTSQRMRLGRRGLATWLERTLHRPSRDEALEAAIARARDLGPLPVIDSPASRSIFP